MAAGRKNKTEKLKNKEVLPALLLTALVLTGVFSGRGKFGNSLRQGMEKDMANAVYRQFMPAVLQYPAETGGTFLPILEYVKQEGEVSPKQAARHTSKIEIPSEWEEETSVPGEEEFPDREQLLWEENQAVRQKEEKEQENAVREPLEEAAFVPREKQLELDWESLADYEELLKQFYTIDANTMAGSDQLDAAKLMGKDMRIEKQSEGPQILIYHTHSQEGFADSVPGDPETSIVGVGEYLTELLTEQYGFQVLHHTGQYDVKTRDDAYSNALPEIQGLLREYPTIQVVIDLHRDEMPEQTRLVMDLDGRPTARFMFFNGLSRTRKTGNLDYLYNEYQEDNLAFSFQMKQKAEEYYPGLTRKIYLKGYRYNMHVCPRSLLIELGAQNNTLAEAMNACGPLAHILNMVLTGT